MAVVATKMLSDPEPPYGICAKIPWHPRLRDKYLAGEIINAAGYLWLVSGVNERTLRLWRYRPSPLPPRLP